MPFVRIEYMKEAHHNKNLNKISKTIQQTLINEFDVPIKDYFQVFQSHETHEFFYDESYFLNSKRSNKLLYIYVTLAPGRSKAEKLRFYKELSTSLSTHCGIQTEDIFILLVETERENWSFGNGLAQALEGGIPIEK
ncbi:tautomerase family protein [Listeria booriae]|uniref:tautomerase family protein n=1 Tax=Listeria booriae TaxID=1552123 RepID=UPI001624EAEA|nr:tautomerase family protein [Listeria booriae]MBC1976474.1 tautomerase family protein [Listeria booriae]MBC2034198.1 tautomerase family protein [Listeria booriae]